MITFNKNPIVVPPCPDCGGRLYRSNQTDGWLFCETCDDAKPAATRAYIFEIDALLAEIEDTAHGETGNKITKIRGLIQKI
jgi:uncharacterized Zn finger protein (UPF0148 family)